MHPVLFLPSQQHMNSTFRLKSIASVHLGSKLLAFSMDGSLCSQIVPVEGTAWVGKKRKLTKTDKKHQRSKDRFFQRHMTALVDDHEAQNSLEDSGKEYIQKYHDAGNKAKAQMREIWHLACGDFNSAGIVLKAKRNAFKEETTEGDWKNYEQLEDELKSKSSTDNYVRFAKQAGMVRYDPKQGCKTYFYEKQLYKCGKRDEGTIEKELNYDSRLAQLEDEETDDEDEFSDEESSSDEKGKKKKKKDHKDAKKDKKKKKKQDDKKDKGKKKKKKHDKKENKDGKKDKDKGNGEDDSPCTPSGKAKPKKKVPRSSKIQITAKAKAKQLGKGFATKKYDKDESSDSDSDSSSSSGGSESD